MTKLTMSSDVLRVGAAYGYRGMAALLDGLTFFAMIFAIATTWLIVARSPAGPAEAEALLPMRAFMVGSIGLYLVIAAMLGGTLGMRALGLRIVSSEGGAAVGPLRALSRTLVLVVAVGFLFAVHPALVLVYPLWMLLDARGRLLHDQIAGTAVIRDASLATPKAGVAEPSFGGPDPSQAPALTGDLDPLRNLAEGDPREISAPLFVLGLLAIGGAVAGWNEFSLLGLLFWATAGPVGLMVTAWWFDRLQRQGVGIGVGSLKVITILVTCLAVVFALFPFGGVITAVGFLTLAFTRHSRPLAVAAIAFGMVTGAEQPFRVISNGITNLAPDVAAGGILDLHGNAVVLALLAALLLGAGATYLRRESSG